MRRGQVTPDSTADVREPGSYPVEREIFPHGFPRGTGFPQYYPKFTDP